MTDEERSQVLQQELDAEQIGEFVSIGDLGVAVEADGQWYDAIKVLLTWAQTIRRNVAAGKNTLLDLWHAEQAEQKAVLALGTMTVMGGMTPELAELVAMIPDRELRERSRRIGLVNEWKTYQSMSWRIDYGDHVVYQKNFLRYPVAHRVAKIPLERTRADRYVDELTRLLLDQLNNGLPETVTSPGFVERDRLWNEAIGPPVPGREQTLHITQYWTKFDDDRIEVLKSRYKAFEGRVP